MSTTPLNLTTALDDAAAELVLLDPLDSSAWDATRATILAAAEGAGELAQSVLKAVAEKMTNGSALSPDQRKGVLEEVNKLVQEGLEKVWEIANAEIQSTPSPAKETPTVPPPSPTSPAAETAAKTAPEPKPPVTQQPSPATPEPVADKPSAPVSLDPPAPAPPPAPEAPVRRVTGGKFLTFFLDKEEFGFEILRVQEIISQLPITPVPRTPDHLRGVINLRGKIIPVVDLRRKLGLAPVDLSGCVIIVKAHNIEVGVSVDQVSEVSTISDDQIEPVPAFGAGVVGEYLLGIGKIGDRVKLLLDVDRTLAPEHLAGARAGGQTVVAMNGAGR